MNISENIQKYKATLPKDVTLVAVSKTKPIADLMEAYNAGQRIFGENKIQEMAAKYEKMPKDIEWHMIGHVQTNKVKYMAPFVDLVHAVESLKLLKEINKQAAKCNRSIKCLLQLKIATEDSKFGMDEEAMIAILSSEILETLSHVKVIGLMGMATFTNNTAQIETEFKKLKTVFTKLKEQYPELSVISMGMSGDYELAIAQGSNMVRIGSSIFGHRNYT